MTHRSQVFLFASKLFNKLIDEIYVLKSLIQDNPNKKQKENKGWINQNESEIRRLYEEINRLNSICLELEKNNEELQLEINDLNNWIDIFKREKNELTNQLKKKDRDCNANEEKLNQVKSELEEIGNELINTNKELQKIGTLKQEAENQIKQKNDEILSLIKNIEDIGKELKQKEDDFRQCISTKDNQFKVFLEKIIESLQLYGISDLTPSSVLVAINQFAYNWKTTNQYEKLWKESGKILRDEYDRRTKIMRKQMLDEFYSRDNQ